LNVGADLPVDVLTDAFGSILESPAGHARDAQLGALLSGLMARGQGPNADQVTGLIRTALSVDRPQPIKVDLPPGERLVCVAGSGKKGVKTMNISTLACIVASSLGAYVAKPASRSTSSVSGSADFASCIGIQVGNVQHSVNMLKATGLGIFSIENMVPGFDNVYGQRMFGPTPLSFALPALLCPVEPDCLLYGLSHPDVALSLEVFERLGYDNVMVVTSTDDDVHFIDELGMFKRNYVGGRRNGFTGNIKQFDPLSELGLPRYRVADIAAAATMQANVDLGVQVLEGKVEGAPRDIVAINAATILYLAGKVEERREGFYRALGAINSGAARYKLASLKIRSNPDSDFLSLLAGARFENTEEDLRSPSRKRGRLVRKLKEAAVKWGSS
jgi:anthranilate phosphoribosyltransferase